MEKENSPCVERIGCMRERILSVWREGDGGARCVDRSLELGAQCVDRSLELGVWIGAWRALVALSACERAQTEID